MARNTKESHKTINKKLLLGGIIGIVLLAAIVIGGILLQPTDKGAAKLSLSPQEQTMAVGETQMLQLVNHTDGSKLLQAKWESSSTAVATVNESGLVTAVSPGRTTVKAIVSIDGIHYTASAKIKVSGKQADLLSVDGSSVPAVEREFLISQKTANVKDYPMQGRVEISDDIKDTYMIFAAGKGTDLHADAWELTGTITKKLLDTPLFLSFGVIDENGKEQWFCILDDGMSLQRYWNWWDTKYDPDGKHVTTNEVSEEFFFRNRLALSFKVVVKDNIMRVYFGASPDSVKLTWELPLTEEKFGGFAEGSKYQLAINTVDPNNMVISGLKTVTGDAVQFDSQQMPGPSPNILYVWDGNVSFMPGIGKYVMGEGDATAMTEKTYNKVTLNVNFCPDVWPIQGFAVKQGDNKVTFRFGSEGYDAFSIVTFVNGNDGPVLSTAFGFSMYGAYEYNVLMAFDGEYINFLTYKDGGLRAINAKPISLAELLGSAYVPGEGIAVGIAGFDNCGRQFDSIWISEKVYTPIEEDPNAPKDLGPLPVMTGNVFYDSSSGMYVMTDGSPTAVTEETYEAVELSANFCPSTWPIQGFAMKQGENMVTVKFGSEGYNASQVMIYKNGTMVSAPTILHEFSLYGAYSYDIKLIYKNGEAWLYFMLDGQWTQLSKYPIVLGDILGSDFDASKGIAVGIAGFENCGRQIKNIVISEEVTLTPQLGLWDHYGVSTAKQRAEEYANNGENGVTTVFVGDSFVDPGFWTTFISDMSGREALCLGIGGSTAEDWLGYLDEEIFLHNISPKNIVFNLGNNDLHNDGELNVYLENMKKLLQTVHNLTPDSKLFMFSVAHRTGAGTNGVVDQANAQMQQWCAEQGWVTFVNISDQLTTDMLFDGIHPQTPYYRSIFLPTLEAAGCEFEGEIVEIESRDVLPVHSGNVIFNENTGMYTMGTAVTDNPTAVTQKAYTEAELTATFCPNTWPVQGFAVKQGSNTVGFKFGSEGYDTHHIMTYVNGAAVAVNPATAFDFSLVGAYSYDMKLSYADGIVNMYLKQDGAWKQINASPIVLGTVMSSFDNSYGVSVGIAGWGGCGRQFSNVAVTGTEGTEAPAAEAKPDILPVHSGSMTFDAASGNYNVPSENGGSAMTAEIYTAVELKTDYFNANWPIMGFQVGNGTDTVAFRFCSNEYDYWSLAVLKNGVETGSAIPSGSSTLWANTKYTLVMSFDGTNINIYYENADGSRTKVNTDPIALADYLTYDTAVGVSVGVYCETTWGTTTFSNVELTQNITQKQDILSVHSGSMTFDAVSGNYTVPEQVEGSAMTAETYTAVELKTDYINGNWPIMGFQVGNGTDTVAFRFCSNEYDYWSLAVLKNGAETGSSIPSGSSTLWANTKYTLVMSFDGTDVNIYYENADGSRTKVNTDPIVLADYLSYDAAQGISVGVYCGTGWGTTTFSNVELGEVVVQKPDALSVRSDSMAFDPTTGTYSLPADTEGFAMTADTYTSAELKFSYVNRDWPVMGIQVGSGSNKVAFRFGSCGYDENSLAVLVNGAADGRTVAATNSSLFANMDYNFVMVFDGTNINIYYEDASGIRTQINNEPIVLADYLAYDAAQGISVGVYCGADWGATTISNVEVSEAVGATRRSPAEPIAIAVLPVSSEQEKIMSLLMNMAVSV